LSPSEVGIPEPDSLLFAEEVMKVKAPIPISLQDVGITGSDFNFLSTEARRIDQLPAGGCQWHHRSRPQPYLYSAEAMKVRTPICLLDVSPSLTSASFSQKRSR
jgi:hypothetical protein